MTISRGWLGRLRRGRRRGDLVEVERVHAVGRSRSVVAHALGGEAVFFLSEGDADWLGPRQIVSEGRA